MGQKLKYLTIRGFKSIQSLENLALGDLNVLIGANGSGKSNFVSFFRLLHEMVDQRLQAYVNKNAPADGFFFNGIKITPSIYANLMFGDNRYSFSLVPTADSRIMVDNESTHYTPRNSLNLIGNGVLEAQLALRKDDPGVLASHGPNWYVWDALSSWQVYHFHDTSMSAGVRRSCGILQNQRLYPDAGNLAPFLFHLRQESPEHYQALRQTVRRIAPYFDDFLLHVTNDVVENQVHLTWRQVGKDYIFAPGHLSDGTIRFICLATVLTQPMPPQTIVLDEPELGLHPEALSILAGLLRSASQRMQIIIATQSPVLLSEFEPSQIITVDQVDGASTFKRLNEASLEAWLDEYTLGDLWQKGTIRGGVNHA